MGTALTGLEIRDTYDALIKVTDNGPLDGTLQTLTDGLGNDSALALSTAGASVTGTFAVSGNSTFDTTTLVVDATNDRVGIGTGSPATPLHVANASAATVRAEGTATNGESTFQLLGKNSAGTARSAIFKYDNSDLIRIGVTQAIDMRFETNDTERMRIDSSGNVGIGNSAPTAKLDVTGTLAVSGTSTFSSELTAATNSNFTGTSTNSRILVTAAGVANTILGFNNSGSTVNGVVNNAGYIGILQDYPLVVTIADAERMRITSAGNVGIGTSSPAATLDVLGTSFLRGNVNAGKTANINVTTAENGTGGGNREFETFTGASATGFTGTDSSDQGYGYFAATIISGRSYEVSATMVVTNGSPLTFITSTGKNFATDTVQTVQSVPVSGTTYRFVASGNASFFGVAASNDGGGMTCVVSNFSLKEVGSVLVTSDSNVGINTSSPNTNYPLSIASASNANAIAVFGRASDNTGSIDFYQSNGSSRILEFGVSTTQVDIYNDLNTPMLFSTNGTERLRITGAGNVGIGTSSPTAKLEVAGGLTAVTGSFLGSSANGTLRAEIAVESPASNNTALIAKTSNGGNDIFRWFDGATQLGVFKNSGNVGIGISSPSSKLHIQGSIAGATPAALLRVGNNGTGYMARMILTDETTADGNIVFQGSGASLSSQFIGFGIGASLDSLKLTGDGYLRMASGTGGIQFNGDTAAANALDDYEEGTFTLTFAGGGTAGTYTPTAVNAFYTKIGRVVTLQYRASFAAGASGGTGNMIISGLPFNYASNNGGMACTIILSSTSWSGSYLAILPTTSASGSDLIIVETAPSTGLTNFVQADDFNTSTDIRFTLTYQV